MEWRHEQMIFLSVIISIYWWEELCVRAAVAVRPDWAPFPLQARQAAGVGAAGDPEPEPEPEPEPALEQGVGGRHQRRPTVRRANQVRGLIGGS